MGRRDMGFVERIKEVVDEPNKRERAFCTLSPTMQRNERGA